MNFVPYKSEDKNYIKCFLNHCSRSISGYIEFKIHIFYKPNIYINLSTVTKFINSNSIFYFILDFLYWPKQ